MTYALGVDIGTSYTAAAVWRDGRATTVGLADRADSIPSAVFLLPDGGLLVGDAALRRGVLEPDRLARGFKRRLGDPAKMLLGDESVGVPELTGHLLRFVVDTVTAREGGPPAHVTLTVPATWGEHHRNLMTSVAEQAQLRDVGLLAEPVAVAVHYAALARLDPGATAAVYDLGGGTFDTALVQRTADGYELRGRPGGDEGIGGEDFDDVVVQHVQRNLGPGLALLDVRDEAVAAGLQQVRQNATAAKEALSHDVEASIAVILPGLTREVRLTRGELETALRIPLLRTVDALATTIASAGLTPADLHSVLLAGGSSRIPLVSQLLVGELGVQVATDAHPKYAVALGAAIAGAQRLAPARPGPPAAAPTWSPPVSAPPSPPSAARAPGPTAVPLPAGFEPPPAEDDWAAAGPSGGPDADLLAPAPVATPAPLVVDPGDVGLATPADTSLQTTGRLPGRLRHLSAADELVVEHHADRRRGGLAVAVAAVVVLLLVGGVAAAVATGLLGDDDAPEARPSASTSASESTEPTDAEPVAPLSLSAQTVTAGPGDLLVAAAQTAVGLVGVGASADPSTTEDPAVVAVGLRVWTSAAGAWTPGTAPAVEAGVSAGATGVAAASSGATVVSGWVASGDGAEAAREERRGRIWVSGDGRAWAPATVPEVGEITDVATRPDGSMVATALSVVASGATDVDAVVLISPDGAVWTVQPSTGLDGPGPLELHGLLAEGSGLLAVGTALEGAVDRSRLWTSSDGLAWTAGAELPGSGAGAATASDLVRSAAGVLTAVGSQTGLDGAPSGVVWHEAGGAWTPQGVDVPVSRLLGAVAAPDGLVVVGSAAGAAAAWSTTG